MFRVISIIGLVIVLAEILLHFIFSRTKLDKLFGRERRWRLLDGLRIIVFLFTLLFLEQKLDFVGIFRKLVYLLAILCFVILAVTGFFPRLVLGKQIYGYWLMLHATAAPVFAACVAALSVMWAHNCRFDKNYWPWLQKILRRQPANNSSGEKYELGQKICFWLIIILALPLILSIVSSMFAIFGTAGQEFLMDTHRYVALLFAIVVIVHTYLTILAQMKE